MTRRAAHPHRPRIIIRAAGGLPRLDAASVWILGALRHLLRRGRPAQRDAWEWVDCFDDLKEQMTLIRDDAEPPANRCPLVPIRMPVAVDVWPEPGEALPLEYDERELGAMDNRRLVGKVAQVVIDHIALHQQAAVRYGGHAQRDSSSEAGEKADGYALEVRKRGRGALRGVDLDELARAVEVETRPSTASPSAADDRVTSTSLEIQFVNDALAILSEGETTVQVRGLRQVWLLRSVIEAGGRTLSWTDLVSADLAAAGEELTRRWEQEERRKRRGDDEPVEPVTPRHAMQPVSLQRAGSRIRKALGKLDYHWHQDGHGARWDSKVT